jgi:hypothetical protein
LTFSSSKVLFSAGDGTIIAYSPGEEATVNGLPLRAESFPRYEGPRLRSSETGWILDEGGSLRDL